MFGIFIMLIFFDRLELDQFSKLYGLFKSNPFVSLFFFLILLSLAGIPPFPGFFQKYLIMKSLFNMNYFIAFVFIIFCSLIIGFYYLRLVALFVGTEVESPVFTLRLSSLGIRSLEFIAYLHLASIFFLYDFFAWCYYVAINLSSAWC
jgi:NADH:ubiquinone oxidoreductase subunit 2 (subunit N)